MKLTELKNCVKVEVANRILPALSEYAVCGGEAAEGMWVGVVGGGGGGLTFAASIFLFGFSCIYLHGTEDMYRVEIIITVTTTTTATTTTTTTTATTTTTHNHNHQIS